MDLRDTATRISPDSLALPETRSVDITPSLNLPMAPFVEDGNADPVTPLGR